MITTTATGTTLEGTVWVNDTRVTKTGKSVRDISTTFDDPHSEDRIFVKQTLWEGQVTEGDELKPKFHGKACRVKTTDTIDWEHPRSTFTDRNGRSCREYGIREAEYHLASDPIEEEKQEEIPPPPSDNPTLGLIGDDSDI